MYDLVIYHVINSVVYLRKLHCEVVRNCYFYSSFKGYCRDLHGTVLCANSANSVTLQNLIVVTLQKILKFKII